MTVSRLGRLLESGDYRRCLTEAQRLVAEAETSTAQRARIHAALCRCHLELGDLTAAAEAGVQAVRFAKRAESWDVLGSALVDLGTAHGLANRPRLAMRAFREFLDGLDRFTAAKCLEGLAHLRLAEALQRTEQVAEALLSFERAWRWFDRYGDETSRRQCTKALFHTYLSRGDVVQAHTWLQEDARDAAQHHQERQVVSSHFLDRALFYLTLEQHADAAQAAFRGLELAEDSLGQQCRAQLLLCRSALGQGKAVEALAFALAARVSAVDGRCYDLEYEATELFIRILATQGEELLAVVAAEFQAVGVDIGSYLPDALKAASYTRSLARK